MQADVRQMLKLSHVDTHYGPIQVLRDVNIEINVGEITCLLGGNASGKSTTLRTIIGMVKPTSGTIEFDGERIDGLSIQQLVERGISMVPENRRIFGRMTVRENLEMGAFLREDDIYQTIDQVYDLFPVLKEKRKQNAGELSGGQRQQVAFGRAMMTMPKVLMLDEPTAGVSPIVMDELFQRIIEVGKTGVAILMVEQNAKQALSIATRGYVLVNGENRRDGSGQELLNNPDVRKSFLGG